MQHSIKNNPYISSLLLWGIFMFLCLFFLNNQFLLWAFERHQNILSWYIRPLLVLPFCYFAYTKNLNGILLIILSIFTSMFWFPAPETVSPQVVEFLQIEKYWLLWGFSWLKIWFFWIVILYWTLLARAFWIRSIKFWILVVILGAVGKIIGSILMTPELWAIAIPFSIWGIIAFICAVWIYKKYFHSK